MLQEELHLCRSYSANHLKTATTLKRLIVINLSLITKRLVLQASPGSQESGNTSRLFLAQLWTKVDRFKDGNFGLEIVPRATFGRQFSLGVPK